MSGSSLNIEKNFSSEIYYSKEYTSVQKNDYGLIKIVITDYFNKRYGEVFASNFASTGSGLKAGDKIFQLKVNKNIIDILSPVNGVIKFVNPKITKEKKSNNLGDNWIIHLADYDLLKDKTSLLNYTDYLVTINNSFNKYQKY